MRQCRSFLTPATRLVFPSRVRGLWAAITHRRTFATSSSPSLWLHLSRTGRAGNRVLCSWLGGDAASILINLVGEAECKQETQTESDAERKESRCSFRFSCCS